MLRRDPEYFATNNKIRANNALKTIDTGDPIYTFDRSDYTVRVPSDGGARALERKRRDDERAFRRVAM